MKGMIGHYYYRVVCFGEPRMDLLVPEDHTLDAGTKQNHTGHV